HAHRAAAPALCRPPRLAGRPGVRGRGGRVQPAARPGVDAAGDLLRVAGTRPGRRAPRRYRLHPPGAGGDPRARRAVPHRHATGVGQGCRGRRGCCGGGGRVLIPLMGAAAVHEHHWMAMAQFLDAVAFGQITPGPVVQTVAVVGYAAAGLGGGLLAALVAFAPSFLFILFGAGHFARLRANRRVRAFLDGAGPAAIGAILGSAGPLALDLAQPWQYAVLAGAAVLLLVLRRGVVLTLLCAGAVGAAVALAGGPV